MSFLDFQPVGVDTIDLVLIFIYLTGILLYQTPKVIS